MTQFHLTEVAEQKPISLPLGIRQRLQLAAACLHKPEVLILDEPTSGVDPAARDMFWEYLIKLSREDKITIFVTTHFMNEAARCDRISLMHRGQVLDVGTPEELRQGKQAATLEEAFILYLEEQADDITAPQPEASPPQIESVAPTNKIQTGLFAWFAIVWTFTLREGKELLRDKVRLFFALGGPTLILVAMASSISFDINPMKFTVLDHDNTSESRKFIEYFSGSHYFVPQDSIYAVSDINRVLQSAQVKLVVEIPAGFGRDMLSGQQPEIGFFIDGAFPAVAENLKGSVTGVLAQYIKEYFQSQGVSINDRSILEVRFIYNQDFKSIFAITPGVIMLAMMMVPSMMTALGVVREKEIGSIMNLYGSPATQLQFLFGKQLPYILLSFFSYLILVWIAIMLFGVPIKGSSWAMFLGAFIALCASTGFGLVVSSFVKSQIAALFATAIVMMIPTLNFSGMMYPTATLDPNVYFAAHLFPGPWFQVISLGGFTKGLGFMDFLPNYLALLAIYSLYLFLATRFLKKQEK